jgi:hypothetical protein
MIASFMEIVMADKDRQFENESLPRVREQLAADLKRLYRPPGAVPAEADRVILERAREHFATHGQSQAQPRRRIRVVFRRVVRVAAVAAVLVIAFLIFPTRLSEQSTVKSPPAPMQTKAASNEDIDHNGRVNILDAFAMARSLEKQDTTEKHWDFNGDGVVDRRDVDVVAYAAVRIPEGG